MALQKTVYRPCQSGPGNRLAALLFLSGTFVHRSGPERVPERVPDSLKFMTHCYLVELLS